MIAVGKEKYPEWEELIAAMSAAAYNSILGTAYLIAPIYGTSIAKPFGFRICMDTLALIDCVFLVLYLLIGNGFSGFKQTFKNYRNSDEIEKAL